MSSIGHVCIYEFGFNENALNLIKDNKLLWLLCFSNLAKGPFFGHLEISFSYGPNGDRQCLPRKPMKTTENYLRGMQ